MAAASMNDIKARIKSVRGTMQITKAMELVATSKLRRAKERAENARPYYQIAGEAIDALLSLPRDTESPYLKPHTGNTTCYLVIAGDRGLAGGYNSNLFRLTAALAKEGDAIYLPVGKKATEHYRRRGVRCIGKGYPLVASLDVGDCMAMAEELCAAFAEATFDRLVLVYTHFTSMIAQTPMYEQLLPLTREPKEGATSEPLTDTEDITAMLDRIIPAYVGGILHSAICEAVASESGARRMAMNAANKNASEMIDTLMLRFNRARQAVITQEITEIVSGAEAL